MQRKRILFLSLLNGAALLSLFGFNWVYDFFQFPASPLSGPQQSRQLILVIGESWASRDGKLQRYERERITDRWTTVGARISVAIGERGFAWGTGLHQPSDLPGPEMDEGDRRTPAGIFSISSVFGHLPIENVGKISLPYRQVTEADICVDDPRSIFYNQIITGAKTSPHDWRSAEPMAAAGDSGYKLGIVFDQNPAPAKPRSGSCIFLHIGPSSGGTFGCTTLPENQLREIVGWLDPKAAPLMVQLPLSVYEQVFDAWDLPVPEV